MTLHPRKTDVFRLVRVIFFHAYCQPFYMANYIYLGDGETTVTHILIFQRAKASPIVTRWLESLSSLR